MQVDGGGDDDGGTSDKTRLGHREDVDYFL